MVEFKYDISVKLAVSGLQTNKNRYQFMRFPNRNTDKEPSRYLLIYFEVQLKLFLQVFYLKKKKWKAKRMFLEEYKN